MPNAEHHGFTDYRTHLLALGSTFASGKPLGEEPRGYVDTVEIFNSGTT
jgi:hypothetical protein